jgi:hypothetical protein
MKTIVKMNYGSKLYGLDLPSSDQDFKGVFLPSYDTILLGKIPRSVSDNIKVSHGSKNTAGDIDYESYSLHNFIDMACKGVTIALDMLHAPPSMLLESSATWDIIVANRSKFYTKRLESYLGFALTQVAKYGSKGGRLRSALLVRDFLGKCKPGYSGPTDTIHMYDIWSVLPTDENVKFVDTETPTGPKTFYEVCGRKIENTLSVTNALDVVNRVIEKYGTRSELAMCGTDWKCVTHAIRACIQLKELYSEGTITFPLKDRDFLMRIKLGELDFESVVSPKLEDLIAEVSELCAKSTLPNKVDRTFWDEFILETIEDQRLQL